MGTNKRARKKENRKQRLDQLARQSQRRRQRKVGVRITIDDPYPARKAVTMAIDVLKKGGVLIYPTDTTYGIGCDLFNKDAIERVYRIKKMAKQHTSQSSKDHLDQSEHGGGGSGPVGEG